ncbi:hypothetical protein [Variovorax paradoxus]|uniref:hypothetical protein n=1 Tax=Variovorax paradoxus TaxID=34073 RepID=UPI003ED07D5B
MPLRYRIVSFSPADLAAPEVLLGDASGLIATALAKPAIQQWSALLQHLISAGAQSLLIQQGVRDPDFIEEHDAFYSKQQRAVPRVCVRVHAFSCPAPIATADADPAQLVLDYIDAAAAQADCYLGFATLRPLRHAPVGATIVVDTPQAPAICKDNFPVHIAGASFEVQGTPYLQQDNAVGACAQASIWMALRTLRRRAGNSAYSPAELTVAATKYTALNRVFPGRQGLTVAQMLEAIRSTSHDPLVISISAPPTPADPAVAIEKAQPYIESGLPVVTLLMNPNTGGHVVVGIGLTPAPHQSTNPTGLIIHNDNQGPYLHLPRTAAAGTNDYALDQTVCLMVPLPDGVFMSAAEALPQAIVALDFWLPAFVAAPLQGNIQLPPLVTRTYLCTRHAFREWAKECAELDDGARVIYRTAELPKFVWVVEVHDANEYRPGEPNHMSRLGEVVLDAAADALHGDALVFFRLTQSMLPVPTTSPGLLGIDDGSVVALAKGDRMAGLAEPWKQV